MDSINDQAPRSRSTVQSLRELGASVISALVTRIELAATEIEEERERIATVLILGFLALVLVTLALIIATFGIIAFFWETHRFTAIIGCSVGYLSLGLLAAYRIHEQSKNRPRFMNASIQELHKDRQLISEILEKPTDEASL